MMDVLQNSYSRPWLTNNVKQRRVLSLVAIFTKYGLTDWQQIGTHIPIMNY